MAWTPLHLRSLAGMVPKARTFNTSVWKWNINSKKNKLCYHCTVANREQMLLIAHNFLEFTVLFVHQAHQVLCQGLQELCQHQHELDPAH